MFQTEAAESHDIPCISFLLSTERHLRMPRASWYRRC